MAGEWRPDPMGRAHYRYFDGTTWTHHVATHGVQDVEPSDMPLSTTPLPPPPVGYTSALPAPYPAAPYGYQPMPQALVEPVTRGLGWAICALGLLIIVSACLPWVSISGFSISGLGGHGAGAKDGVITLPLGIVAAVLGLLRGLATRRSGLQLTVGIIGLLIGGLVAIIGLADIGSVDDANGLGDSFGFDVGASVGIGLIVTLIAGIGLACVSIAAIIKRS